MSNSNHGRTTPSQTDGDGVRVIRAPGRARLAFVVPVLIGVAVVAGIVALALSLTTSKPNQGQTGDGDAAAITESATPARVEVRARKVASTTRTQQRASPAVQRDDSPSPDDLPSGDPNDIATYVSATDPEPTAAEVIQALHDIGDHTGIGAFNPPGTSPPLFGIAVPEDFPLPPGYVRHHQVTDEGEPIEPILMFSPEAVFLDASGREIELPEDRVVPPDMAPPGLPIREITIPPKP